MCLVVSAGSRVALSSRLSPTASWTSSAGMVRPVCTPDCPDRHPACSDRCEKYRAWKAEVQKEKIYTKSQNDARKINRNDFDAEFWMGGKHK